MNTFAEVSEEYNRQYLAKAINYAKIERGIMAAAKNDYPEFSEDKLKYIWSQVYSDKHSCFGDCIFEMDEMCNFVKNMPK